MTPTQGVEWLYSDLEQDYRALSHVAATASFVFHCAGVVSKTTRSFAANVEMTRNVVRALDESSARLILLSSVRVYGSHGVALVDDVAGALVALAMNPNARGSTFNVSQCCSLQELVAVVQKTLNIYRPVSMVPMWLSRMAARIGDVLPAFPFTSSRLNALTCSWQYSGVRLEEIRGWTFPVALADRISQIVQEWYR